jgi:hypothetical protein
MYIDSSARVIQVFFFFFRKFNILIITAKLPRKQKVQLE